MSSEMTAGRWAAVTLLGGRIAYGAALVAGLSAACSAAAIVAVR